MCKKRKKRKRKPKINRPTFHVFKVGGSHWTWLLEASNGKVYAQCNDAYIRKRDCLNAVQAIQNMASACKIEVLD